MRDLKDHTKSNSPVRGTLRVGRHDPQEIASEVFQRLQPVLIPYGMKTEELAKAVQEAVRESGKVEVEQAQLFGVVLYKLLVRDSPLWISPHTPGGIDVPLELLVAAYAIWREAELFAWRHGVDGATAAEALVEATHATAEQLSRNDARDRTGETIGDLKSYLFTGYMRLISAIEKRLGSAETDYVDLADWVLEQEFSDMGDCLEALDNAVFCREFLGCMPREGRSAAVARYVLGYTWEETAEALGTSVNAAQKALSAGIRKAVGMCMRQLKKTGGLGSLQTKPLKRRRNKSTSKG